MGGRPWMRWGKEKEKSRKEKKINQTLSVTHHKLFSVDACSVPALKGIISGSNAIISISIKLPSTTLIIQYSWSQSCAMIQTNRRSIIERHEIA